MLLVVVVRFLSDYIYRGNVVQMPIVIDLFQVLWIKVVNVDTRRCVRRDCIVETRFRCMAIRVASLILVQ